MLLQFTVINLLIFVSRVNISYTLTDYKKLIRITFMGNNIPLQCRQKRGKIMCRKILVLLKKVEAYILQMYIQSNDV